MQQMKNHMISHEINYYQSALNISMDENNNNNSKTTCDSLQKYWKG